MSATHGAVSTRPDKQRRQTTHRNGRGAHTQRRRRRRQRRRLERGARGGERGSGVTWESAAASLPAYDRLGPRTNMPRTSPAHGPQATGSACSVLGSQKLSLPAGTALSVAAPVRTHAADACSRCPTQGAPLESRMMRRFGLCRRRSTCIPDALQLCHRPRRKAGGWPAWTHHAAHAGLVLVHY